MSAPDLAYVALAVEDPERIAAIFETDLGLTRHTRETASGPAPVLSVGRSVLALFRPDDPFLGADAKKGVHHIAVTAADPEAAARTAGLRPIGRSSTGLNRKRQVEIDRNETAGIRLRFTEPLDLPAGRTDIVEQIDHLGVASADNGAIKRAFIDGLGCVYESEQTDSEVETVAETFVSDKYPEVRHERASRLVGSMRVTFITIGDCELECLQDLTVDLSADAARHDAAGNTRADRSAIARFIDGRGAGLHHIALKTPDIDAALGRLAAAGHRVIDRTGRPGSRRARIGFVHPSALGGVLLHFVEREEL